MVSQPVRGGEVIYAKARGWGGVRACGEFTSEALAAEWASLDFDVPPELSCDNKDDVGFEFSFLHLGNADLTVSAANLQEIGAGDLPAKPPKFPVSPQKTTDQIFSISQSQ